MTMADGFEAMGDEVRRPRPLKVYALWRQARETLDIPGVSPTLLALFASEDSAQDKCRAYNKRLRFTAHWVTVIEVEQ
ncbi:hypothetical protein SEA_REDWATTLEHOG_105 [Gordonia phage RedWattleHog]|uniref:Uncharacterized protein n=1 Tax=Gordonia phage Stormageddon TaxID=2656541 RepID=A0A649VRZ2_9CAUD|nr:hypothetical protein KHQ86_gp197 [Gordonia phage Stormageddon]QGJ94964.1 hypothetical protein SEA_STORMAGEDDON_103 [Gordonia phage Stormageddon]QLF83608.1 hypothetical protein SEA_REDWATTLEHOG_105 [Gordonia phage RedWattleHog]